MYMFPCPTTAGGMANPIRRSHTRNPLRSSFAPPLVGIYGPNEIARARVAYLKAGTDSEIQGRRRGRGTFYKAMPIGGQKNQQMPD